jgi:exopolysaccharide biosynthesis polyprenyl glycosylphosphotransferase
MLRRQRQIRIQIQKALDAMLLALSFWLAHSLRSHWQFEIFGGTKDIQPFEDYFRYFLLTIPFAWLFFSAQGFYDRPLIASRRQTWWQLFQVCILTNIAIILVMVFVNRELLGRSVFVLFGVIAFLLVALKEELLRRWLETKVGRDQLRRRFILAGTAEDTARVRAEIKQKSSHDTEIIAELNVNDMAVEQVVDLLHEHSANGIILSAKHTYFGQIEKVIQACELEGVEVWLLADFFKTQISQTTLDELYGRPILVFRSAPAASWQGVAKEFIDSVGAFFALAVAAPFMLAFGIAIRLSSPGPILFRQLRSGLNGKPFTMYKFRSMVTNAEQLKHELAVLNEMDGPVFKVTNDPRVTRFGRFLRRYSFDELPQLWNVLRGEMSLVGPRPLPVDEVRRFDDLAHRRRLSVKPGLTCLWQISGRNNVTDFKDWVRLDLEYIDNWSIWLDFKILVRTIPIVLSGTGAK